jgi:hypothetical protein
MLRPIHHRIFRNTIPLNNTMARTALAEKAPKASDRPLLEAAPQDSRTSSEGDHCQNISEAPLEDMLPPTLNPHELVAVFGKISC